jgi:GH15 family glucan-1,4-alpha-glucosidase
VLSGVGKPALFSSLIGGAGAYVVTPADRFVWGGYYEPGTLIWHSRWVTDHGIVDCREALARPADGRRAALLRQVRGLEGTHHVVAVLDARHDFGSSAMRRIHQDDNGLVTGNTGSVVLRWQVPPGAHARPSTSGRGLALVLDVAPGSTHDLVLEMSLEPFDEESRSAADLWRETESSWRSASAALERRDASRDAIHAHAVLTGLTTSAGGTVAAATTSLPERADTGRNYDYRHVWIRDQSYIGQAAAAGHADALLDASVSFVRDRLLDDGPDLMPAYTAGGGALPSERSLALPGYPGGGDVVGNHVNEQFQLDVFGEALLLFAAADRAGRLDELGWRAASVAADTVERRWTEADAGVWELSSDAWTHSRLQCVAGLRQMSARVRGNEVTTRGIDLADRIVADTTALHRSGRWQRAPADDRVDAALLLAAIRGAIPADDPRTVATIAAVEEELMQDGFVYRYRPDPRPLGDAEGAFLVCGFWLALAKWQQGEQLAAVRCFDRHRTACGPPGLLSEEFDVGQRHMRGNLPQAFVHGSLLETAAVIGV